MIELDQPLEGSFRLTPAQQKALKKLGLKTINDLLYHFPTRYGDTAKIKTIESLQSGDETVLFGKISQLKTDKTYRKKMALAKAKLTDETGSLKLVWFHQPYIAKLVQNNASVRVEGKVLKRQNELYMSNPKIEVVGKLPFSVGDSLFGSDGERHTLYPIYPESRGITSNWFYYTLQKIFKSGLLDKVIDPIPKEILDRYHLPALATALIWIHRPQKEADAISARKRFAFEEVFMIQLERQQEKLAYETHDSFVIKKTKFELADFIKRFPFTPTRSQQNAIKQILKDFASNLPMSRLLEGDVGSGKTAVAAATAYAITTTRPTGQDYGALQTAYMAPTEILAKQHFENFINFFSYLNINIGLITSSSCYKFPSKIKSTEATTISRAQLLKWVAGGEIPILIGTHSLIQKSIQFKNLAYIIIDEQHRFGVNQRQKLRHKQDNCLPHLLSMTATPIPRTLALTIFGDLDLTVLDEMPAGRKPIITDIVRPTDRQPIYEKIRAELKQGRQLYVICPRIDEPDPDKELALIVKSVKAEAKRLKQEIFPEYEIGVLHSKLKPKDKDAVMNNFLANKYQILCATSVVEVGVNVPNATMIIIEGAERFGLAQLHQLRGRVIRSNHQAYCFVFADSQGAKTTERLKALKTAKNGFELAEFDLQQRGGGALSGTKQWGITDLGMEAIKNLKMVEAARTEATRLIKADPELNQPVHQSLKNTLDNRHHQIHFE